MNHWRTPTLSARLSVAQRPPVAQVRLRWRGTIVLRRHELPTHGAPPFAHSCRPLTLSSATPRNFPVEGTKRREQRPRLSSEGSRSAAHSSADVQPTASGGRQHPPQGVGLDCSVPALAQVAPARGVAIRSNSVHSRELQLDTAACDTQLSTADRDVAWALVARQACHGVSVEDAAAPARGRVGRVAGGRRSDERTTAAAAAALRQRHVHARELLEY